MAGRLNIRDYPIEIRAAELASEIGYQVTDEITKKAVELAKKDRRRSVEYDDIKNVYQRLFNSEIPK